MSALLQQSDEWLALRRTKIGASDAPVIMGVSPWLTPFKLWQEKLELLPERKATWAMKQGIKGEDPARVAFINETGIIVSPDVVFHADNEFMMASLDGISVDRKHIVEIKRPGLADHDIACTGNVPEKYYPQIQHQLDCCGLDMAYYYSFFNETDTVLLQVYRDDKYIKRMVGMEKEFWGCINEFVSPKLSQRDYEQRDDDIWQYTAAEWLSTASQLKILEKREKELRELLISQSQNSNSIGSGVKVAKILRKGNIQYSAIPELSTVNLDQYRAPVIETWRITEE